MTQPLALVCYERLLPGSQLVNRLQDLGYRVHVASEIGKLVDEATQVKPMIALVDLGWRNGNPSTVIDQLRKSAETQHIPVIAFTDSKQKKLQNEARAAGATLVASDAGILAQLPQLLEQALEV